MTPKIALIVAALAMTTLAMPAAPVAAAPAEQGCGYNAVTQADMAGVYVSIPARMRVEMAPCGGTHITWDNAWGRHAAFYVSRDRLPSGGIVAGGMQPDPIVGYLDNTATIGLKPGIPGTIQVITVSPYGEVTGVYTLRKI